MVSIGRSRLTLENTPLGGTPDAFPTAPSHFVTWSVGRKNCARGSPPKSRYSGHQNSRLMRGASKHGQTKSASYYMREGWKDKVEDRVRLETEHSLESERLLWTAQYGWKLHSNWSLILIWLHRTQSSVRKGPLSKLVLLLGLVTTGLGGRAGLWPVGTTSIGWLTFSELIHWYASQRWRTGLERECYEGIVVG